MEVELNGKIMPSTIRISIGDKEAITRCLNGKISTTSIFLPFNSMEAVGNAMELEQ